MNQRKRKTIINNIESINMEIDYEKLADAIVKAQKGAELKNELKVKARHISAGLVNMIFYFGLFGISFLSILLIWEVSFWSSVTERVVATIVLSCLAVFFIVCAFESTNDKEKDSYLHLSMKVSLVSLIVSLVALFKG